MKYRPEIDGLRSIAIVPVILFHADIGLFSGGYIGVDVFFVISGYLITALLIGDLEAGQFSLLRFYERRARRILPALFFVILCCLPPALILMLPSQNLDFAHSLMAVVVFGSNILFWNEEGYFGPAAEMKPLLHTWSLAVEEQFYLLFPLVLWGLWRFGRRRIFWSLLATALVSLALSEWGWRHKPFANFYLAPTRAWELLAGSLAALHHKARPLRGHDGLAALGLAAILVPLFLYDNTTPFPSLHTLAPVLGATCVILFASRETLVGRGLATRIPVGLGLISYSAYLWHQPLFAFARLGRTEAPPSAMMLALAGLSLVLALLSWRLVEQPFRRSRHPWLPSRRSLFLTCFGVGALLFGIGLAGHFGADRIAAFWLSRNPEIARSYQLLDQARQRADFGRSADGQRNLAPCRFDVPELDDKTRARLQDCRRSFGPGVLILGDSHAVDLYGMVASRFDDAFLVGLTKPSCRAHDDRQDCPYDALMDFVATHPGVFRRVIYEQAGFYLMTTPDGGPGNRDMFAALALTRSVGAIGIDATRAGATLDYLTRLGRLVPVTWFGPRVEPHLNDPLLLRMICGTPVTLRPGQAESFDRLDQHLAEMVRDAGGINYVSQIALMSFDASKDMRECDSYDFIDGDHYSEMGEIRFGARLPADFLSR